MINYYPRIIINKGGLGAVFLVPDLLGHRAEDNMYNIVVRPLYLSPNGDQEEWREKWCPSRKTRWAHPDPTLHIIISTRLQ